MLALVTIVMPVIVMAVIVMAVAVIALAWQNRQWALHSQKLSGECARLRAALKEKDNE